MLLDVITALVRGTTLLRITTMIMIIKMAGSRCEDIND